MPFLFPNKLLNEGMRSAVSCQILEGSLPIQFDWTKDGLSLGSSGIDGVTIRGNDEYSSTLIIDHLRFLHRGNYTCKASNAAGFATHSAELTVNGKHTDLYLYKNYLYTYIFKVFHAKICNTFNFQFLQNGFANRKMFMQYWVKMLYLVVKSKVIPSLLCFGLVPMVSKSFW